MENRIYKRTFKLGKIIMDFLTVLLYIVFNRGCLTNF